MCGRPLTNEQIWGIPDEQMPQAGQERNLFDESQPIREKEEIPLHKSSQSDSGSP